MCQGAGRTLTTQISLTSILQNGHQIWGEKQVVYSTIMRNAMICWRILKNLIWHLRSHPNALGWRNEQKDASSKEYLSCHKIMKSDPVKNLYAPKCAVSLKSWTLRYHSELLEADRSQPEEKRNFYPLPRDENDNELVSIST